MQVREKVEKSRNTAFFQWFEAPEGRKVTVKNPRSQTTVGSWDVKKVHTVVARSTFPSQNVQNTPGSDHFWKLSKKCTPLWRETHFQVKMYKKHQDQTTFGSWDVEKCTPLWREAHFQVKSVKNCGFWNFSDVQMWKQWTLTNLTNLTNLTDLSNWSQLTNKPTNN